MRRNGTITCCVTGSRQYSVDLPQGGLEIPCVYNFEGQADNLHKLTKLLSFRNYYFREKGHKDTSREDDKEIASKRIKVDEDDCVLIDDDSCTQKQVNNQEEIPWLKIGTIVLDQNDYDILSGGMRLNDKHINACQVILRSQFQSIKGLNLTHCPSRFGYWVGNYLQIVHCGSNHWITISSIGCNEGEVKVYDSLYCSVSNDIKPLLKAIFGTNVAISLPMVQKQIGSMDCGLFAIAYATFLAHGNDSPLLSIPTFKQHNLRSHLIDCFKKGTMSKFV